MQAWNSAQTSRASAGGPRERLVGLQLRRLQHAALGLERLDVMHERRPAVEAVLARERVLRRRQRRRLDRRRATCRDVPWPACGAVRAKDAPADAGEAERT